MIKKVEGELCKGCFKNLKTKCILINNCILYDKENGNEITKLSEAWEGTYCKRIDENT